MRTNDLTRMASYLERKLNNHMQEMLTISRKVSSTVQEMETLAKVRHESLEMARPKRLKTGADLKNRHQIGKQCGYCMEFIDPRGFWRHEKSCAKKHKRPALPTAA